METPADPAPAPDHNLPPIAKLGEEMTHHAGLWSRNAGQGDKHNREVMVRAYRLRAFAEDPDTELLIAGMLSKSKIPQTKRSDLFTQLLHFAYHKVNVKPEKSQLSRCAGALRHAWAAVPRPAPEALLDFIKREGGDVECALKARRAAKEAGGDGDATGPQPIPITCELPPDIFPDGKTRVAGWLEKTPSGATQFTQRKAVSSETTQEPEPAA